MKVSEVASNNCITLAMLTRGLDIVRDTKKSPEANQSYKTSVSITQGSVISQRTPGCPEGR